MAFMGSKEHGGKTKRGLPPFKNLRGKEISRFYAANVSGIL
jgi:hypothetical protein